MKRSIIKFTGFILLSLALISCDKDDNKQTAAPTFDAFVQATPELSMFGKAVEKAGLNSFKGGPGPFTWFAPTNAAFAAAGITDDSLNRLTPSQVSYLMMYHLANADLSGTNLIAVNSSPRNSQLGTGTGQFYIGSWNDEYFVNGTKIASRDNKISNGTIQIINRFHTPPALRGNIQSILNSTGQHTLFIQALQRANLWSSFATASVFTVFAPTDAAMQAAGYSSTSIAAATPATLAAAMRYHYILNIRLFTNDLSKPTIPATAAGSSQYLTTSDKGTKIKGKNNPSPVNITRSDLLGVNGVVHIIDGVLRP